MEDPFGLEDADEVLIEDFPDDGWEGELGGAGEEAEEDLPGGQPGNLLAEGHDVEADIDGHGDAVAAGLPRSVHQINHKLGLVYLVDNEEEWFLFKMISSRKNHPVHYYGCIRLVI